MTTTTAKTVSPAPNNTRHSHRQHDRQDVRPADHGRHAGPARDRRPQALYRSWVLHLRPGLHLDRQLRIEDHLHRRRAGHPAPSRLSHPGAGRAQRLHGGLLSAARGRAADRRAEEEVRARHHPSHDAARAAAQRVPRVPPRRPSDGRHDRRGRRDVGLLSRQHGYRRSASAHDRLAPADREDADHHGLRLQVLGRPALHLSAQQVQLRRELPQHDLRRAGGGLQDRSGRRAGDGPHLHPACRPRAERLDVDGAHRRVERRQSRSPASPPASPRCGDPRMAAPTKPCSTMLREIGSKDKVAGLRQAREGTAKCG